MPDRYAVIFEGKFKSGIERHEIRQGLLKLYGEKHETVDRFFSHRRLIIRKNIDYQTARRHKTIIEKTGILCRVIAYSDTGAPPEEKPALKRNPQAQRSTDIVPSKGGRPVPPGPPGTEEAGIRQGETSKKPGEKGDQRAHMQAATQSRRHSLFRGSKRQNTFAAIMILLLLLSAGMRIWALQNARGIYPPDNVSSNGTLVGLHFNGVLFLLTPDGQLRKRMDLSALGLRGKPADMQLLADGDVIIGDFASGDILRCDMSDLSCQKIGPAGDYSIRENFKFLADEVRGLLFIADTNNHALLVQDLEGSYIRGIESRSDIRYPNDMTLDRNGMLWLSNTYHSSVLSFAVEDDGIVQTEHAIQLRPRLTGVGEIKETMKKNSSGKGGDIKALMERLREIKKEQRKLGKDFEQTRPLALKWDTEGLLWVVASDGVTSTAGVRVFSPEGKEIKRIPLGEEAIPVDIEGVGKNILVADSSLFQVLSVNAVTGAVVEFGNEDFRAEMAEARSELERYEGIRKWAGRSIWLLALGTIILVLVVVIKNHKTRDRAVRPERKRAISEVRPEGRPSPEVEAAQPAGVMKRYRLEFTGSGGEYFRIWIVNTFLTIATAGVYAAWAKVRTRRYFYRNIRLGGHAFDYTADPMAIFRGYVIVGSGILIYYLSEAFNPFFSLIIFALFGLIIPFLIYKSLRFFAHNSIYRNIRLRFLGSVSESYRAYLFYPLLIPFTLGLIVPYWAFLRKKYFFHNLAFGKTNNTFSGNHGPFYQVYIIMGLAVVGIIITGIIIMSAVMVGMVAGSSPDSGTLSSSIIFMLVFMYGMILIVSTFSQQYIYAWELNYCLRNSEMGALRFESTLNGGRLFWIRISNIFAIIFSMGLLIPWAKVRRMCYIVDNISLITGHDLNEFTAAVETDESAYGDAATDFFDFDIGL